MIERGERVPWWRVWLLSVRAVTGWGSDEEELPKWRRFYTFASRVCVALSLLLTINFVVIYDVLPRFHIAGSRTLSFAQLGRLLAPVVSIPLALAFIMALLSIAHRRRAKAGAHALSTSLYGECFAAAIGWSHTYFALIGPTRQSAQWFRLPIDWDTTVEPCADRFSLTYNPATGFVSELKRIGAQPQTLLGTTEALEVYGPNDALPGDPTKEQRREMLQIASRGGMYWGCSTSSMMVGSIVMLLTSAGLFIFMIAFAIPALSPLRYSKSSDFNAVVTVVAILAATLVATVLFSVYTLFVWRRFQRSDALGSAILVGGLIRFTLRGSRSNLSSVWLALVARDDDGEQVLLCVPRKLEHRLWAGPGRVRVTYNPASYHVLDLRHITEPVVERD